MREDIKTVLRQYRHEIIEQNDLFEPPYVEDWWHYLDDIAINVHDYEETGKVHINIYDYFEDSGPVDMQENYTMTLEEFKKL